MSLGKNHSKYSHLNLKISKETMFTDPQSGKGRTDGAPAKGTFCGRLKQ